MILNMKCDFLFPVSLNHKENVTNTQTKMFLFQQFWKWQLVLRNEVLLHVRVFLYEIIVLAWKDSLMTYKLKSDTIGCRLLIKLLFNNKKRKHLTVLQFSRILCRFEEKRLSSLDFLQPLVQLLDAKWADGKEM